jgi:hypothetical protein
MKKISSLLCIGVLLHAQNAPETFFEQPPKRTRTKERTSQKRQKCAEEIAEHLHLLAANTTLSGQLTELSLELITDELAGSQECSFHQAPAQELDALHQRLVQRNKELREENNKKHDDVCLLRKMNTRKKNN